MNSDVLNMADSYTLLVLCAVPVLLIAAAALLFLKRAYAAALCLGVEKRTLQKVIANSALFSILPSLPIIIIMAAMMPVFGRYVPWLRLSVIGSAMYEAMAADTAVKSFGLSGIGDPGLTPEIFLSAVWVMTISILSYPLANILFLKTFDTRLKQAAVRSESSGSGFVKHIAGALFIGLMSVMMVPDMVNFSNPAGMTAVLTSGAAVLGLETAAKRRNIRWLHDFSFPIAFIIGLAAAAAAAQLLAR
jgi:hypothetical protein